MGLVERWHQSVQPGFPVRLALATTCLTFSMYLTGNMFPAFLQSGVFCDEPLDPTGEFTGSQYCGSKERVLEGAQQTAAMTASVASIGSLLVQLTLRGGAASGISSCALTRVLVAMNFVETTLGLAVGALASQPIEFRIGIFICVGFNSLKPSFSMDLLWLDVTDGDDKLRMQYFTMKKFVETFSVLAASAICMLYLRLQPTQFVPLLLINAILGSMALACILTKERQVLSLRARQQQQGEVPRATFSQAWHESRRLICGSDHSLFRWRQVCTFFCLGHYSISVLFLPLVMALHGFTMQASVSMNFALSVAGLPLTGMGRFLALRTGERRLAFLVDLLTDIISVVCVLLMPLGITPFIVYCLLQHVNDSLLGPSIAMGEQGFPQNTPEHRASSQFLEAIVGAVVSACTQPLAAWAFAASGAATTAGLRA
eukprot:CAMPEP_0197909564 /NCGR_PEP_ID=MMETSP1439-20131203/69140_1 /TAXON_ID=66791 /ORGANISM="Gonyaulax spinifera, Strain CCMP409" /LENGTH=428 /DNA_ID=CAMNT_0043531157 /DNA_START=95 /DNA_END=1378 /DNA_ORIENTATION=+